MNYIKQIKNYKPINEQEKKDKEVILNFINNFSNILFRENTIAHLTASSWIVNKERTKVLLAYHKIYDSWSWTGGHADGCSNLLEVAIKEAKEETGIQYVKPIINDIYSLETLCVDGHIKKGIYVTSHLHLNVTYLLEADDTEALRIKADENLAVKWFSINDALNVISEVWMVENIYKKLNYKLDLINQNIY